MPRQPTAQKPANEKLYIRIDGDKVTADIVNCPLQKALQELAERTGIIFELRSHDAPLVSIHLNKIPLEEAIQRIASNHNAVFYYESDNSNGRIMKARVYPQTPNIQQPAIVYFGTGTITKTNDDIDTAEQAVKVLAEDKRLAIKEKALKFLMNNKSEEAAKALMDALNDPMPEIRVAAIGGLVTFEKHDALTEIVKCLKDENPEVRKSAITAIALLGNDKNIPDIKPLSKDRDAGVALEAELAINKLSAGVRK